MSTLNLEVNDSGSWRRVMSCSATDDSRVMELAARLTLAEWVKSRLDEA